MYAAFFKRIIDFIGALVLLIVASPVLIIIIILLAFVNEGKPFFFQIRPGKNDKEFRIIKFKSMNDKKDAAGNLLPDNQRITKIGGFVRKVSLDELPQIINVLKGDMSFVGPRPLLYKYIPLYSTEQRRRTAVRPGITGWAQVNGRNSISWTEKFQLDIYYVDNISLMLDIKIALMTVLKVVKQEGVNQGDERPMEPFTGLN